MAITQYGQASTPLIETDGNGGHLGIVTGPTSWTAVHNPSTATQATIAKAAGGAGVKHVCTGIVATIATGTTAQTPLSVYLRDGASGAGTIIATGTLSAPANSGGVLALLGLHIVGSANTAMTLEFSGAGVTASLQAVTLMGYDTN